MKRVSIESVFQFLVCTLFFLPLVVYVPLWNPFESPKVFLFLFLIELGLPLYAYLIWKYPVHRPSFKDPFILTLIAFLVFETIAAVIGKDPWNSFFGNAIRMDGLVVWYHLFFFSLYLQWSLKFNPHNREKFIRCFLLVAGIVASIGCLQAINIIPLFGTEFDHRVSATLGNPIFLSSILLIPFFLSIAKQNEERKRGKKRLYQIIAILCLLALFATQTRGAFVGLVAGAIVGIAFWFWKTRTSKNNRTILFSTALILILFVGSFFCVRSFSPSGSLLNRLTHFSGQTTDSRLAYWSYSVKGWQDSPWFGVGYQNYYTVVNKYYQSALYVYDSAWPDKPHNTVLEVLVTGGIFTCFAYLALFFLAFRSIVKKNTHTSVYWKAACIAGLTAYFVQNLFSFDTISSLVTLFIFFAFVTVDIQTTIPSKSIRVSPLVWILFVFPIGLCYVLFPVMQEFHLISVENNIQRTNRQGAFEILEQTKSLPFIYDKELLAKEYASIQNGEFAQGQKDTPLLDQAYTEAAKNFKDMTILHPLRSEDYYLFSFVSHLQARATKTPASAEAIHMAEQSHTLTPNRVEPLISLANMYDTNNDEQKAIDYGKQALQLSPHESKSLWLLALYYARAKDLDHAAPLAIESIQRNISLKNADSLGWLINYYADKKDTSKLVFLYEFAVKINPNNFALLPKLAGVYKANGQKDKAIATANLFLEHHPEAKASIDAFIQSLH